MVGSNVLVNILKPVNIVNLGSTLRCGVGKKLYLIAQTNPSELSLSNLCLVNEVLFLL